MRRIQFGMFLTGAAAAVEGTRYGIYEGVRETYDGPFSVATDNMVWNISKAEITERMVVSPDAA